jgi:hypothetical protein
MPWSAAHTVTRVVWGPLRAREEVNPIATPPDQQESTACLAQEPGVLSQHPGAAAYTIYSCLMAARESTPAKQPLCSTPSTPESQDTLYCRDSDMPVARC